MRLRWAAAAASLLVVGTACGRSAVSFDDVDRHRGSSGGSVGTGGTSGETIVPEPCRRKVSNHVPGARLRPKYAVTSDGDREWKGWHDTELGLDCSFLEAADGTLRCFPESAHLDALPTFLDENCTEEVVGVRACGAVTHVSWTEGQSSCARGTSRVYEVGAIVTPSTVYFGPRGSCARARAEPTATYYRLGAEVDPSSLVQGSAGPLPSLGRIVSLGITASDGSIEFESLVDDSFGEACEFRPLDAGTSYCVPVSSFSSGFWGDSGCRVPLVRHNACNAGDTVPPYAFVQDCSGPRLVEVQDRYPGRVYGAGCTEDFSNAATYAVGDDVPYAVLQAAKRTVVDDDPRRLKPVFLTTDDGSCWFDGWHDSELSTDCTFELFPDGTYRCTPKSDALPWATFSDADCSIDAPTTDLGPCAVPVLPKFAVDWTRWPATCRYVTDVWPTADQVSTQDPPLLWEKPNGSPGCLRAPLFTGNTYMTLAARLDSSALVAAELRVE